MKLKIILLASLFAFGFAMSASAGAVTDGDSDLVPDQFDNCDTVKNGPNEAPKNQRDTDVDGYGNACDPDYDQNNAVTPTDFAVFLADFGGAGDLTDHDGNGAVTVTDFSVFLLYFGGPQGSSGLACAGNQPCTP
jgi:hypothetical protein